MRRPVAALAGILILVVGLTGGALAYSAVTPQSAKIAKACTTAKHVLVLKQNGSCPGSSSPAVIPTLGGPGQVLGYAHINTDGTFDGAHSWKVKASNMVTTSAGFYCFKGLPFTPKGAQITADYYGLSNGDVPTYNVLLPADPTDCGLTSAQIEVFTGLVNTDTFGFTAGTHLGFYVVFY